MYLDYFHNLLHPLIIDHHQFLAQLLPYQMWILFWEHNIRFFVTGVLIIQIQVAAGRVELLLVPLVVLVIPVWLRNDPLAE